MLGKLALLAFIGMSSAFLGACGKPNRSLNLSRNSTELSSVPWTRQFGSRHDDWATSMALDQRGNILVSGYTKGSLPGQAHYGRRDAFVRKYDSEGNELWTRQFGSSESDFATSIAVDESGNVLVAGSTEGSLPGQTNAGLSDAFVHQFDSNGNELFTQQFGSSNDDIVRAIAVDESGNVLAAGFTKGSLPGQTHAGDADAFVRKYGFHLYLAQGAAGENRKTVATWP